MASAKSSSVSEVKVSAPAGDGATTDTITGLTIEILEVKGEFDTLGPMVPLKTFMHRKVGENMSVEACSNVCLMESSERRHGFIETLLRAFQHDLPLKLRAGMLWLLVKQG